MFTKLKFKFQSLGVSKVMNGINQQVLLKALAQWLGQTKNPYHSDTARIREPITLHSNCTHAWLEFKILNENTVLLNCVHRLFQNSSPTDLHEVRQEVRQFNNLMEKVMLPVYVWENPDNHRFQLLWQEQIRSHTELECVQRVFEQSMFIANALESKMGWAVNNTTRPMHH